jgi:hypothetical protein
MVSVIESDTTLRWPCREGDFVLWIRWPGVLAEAPRPDVVDLWALRDGDFITITNRLVDLPAWFELHPTEVQGLLAHEMGRKLEQGYQAGEVIDGPNLWRLKAGDRMVWVGVSRPGSPATNGIIAILDFHECALAIGESSKPQGLLEFVAFGALKPAEDRIGNEYAQDVARCHTAFAAVQNLGGPDVLTDGGWALG